jgi:uncharacterized protein
MDWLLIFLTFIMSVLTSMLTGFAGGGGGFIAIPFYLLIGLAPAQALATSKLGGVGTAAGAFTAFKGKGLVRKGIVLPLLIITFVCALIGGWLIPQIDATLFENIVAVMLIALLPTIFIKKDDSKRSGDGRKFLVTVGYVLYAIVCLASAIVGSGAGTLLVLILIYFFGLSALEANATKRVAQALQMVLILVILALQGFVVWPLAAAAVTGAFLGSHIGGKIAIKKGEGFVKIVLALVVATSAAALIIG